MNTPSVTYQWLRHKLYSKREKIYQLSAAPIGVSRRVLVSDRSLATPVEVVEQPETPGDSLCEPCSRCSLMGMHDWFILHAFRCAYLCNLCAAHALLAGEDNLHSTVNCPTCASYNVTP